MNGPNKFNLSSLSSSKNYFFKKEVEMAVDNNVFTVLYKISFIYYAQWTV